MIALVKSSMYVAALLFLSPTVFAQQRNVYFEYSPLARGIYRKIFTFHLEDARSALKNLRSREPGNLVVVHLENYLELFLLYASEDRSLYQNLKKNEEARLKLLQQGNQNSPYYYYAQADVLLHWAFLKLRFGEYLAAFTSISKAYKLLQRNQAKFPAFLPNLKNLGILHAMVGAVPDNYRWSIRMISGLRGSIRQGKTELETVLAKSDGQDFLFREEALLLYSYLLLNISNEPDKAWQNIQNASLSPKTNLLHAFLMASIALQCKHNEEALSLLQNRPRSTELLPFPYLDFLHGTAQLRKLDTGASGHFLSFIKTSKGENGIKEAYQKLAWAALLNNDVQAYQRFRSLVLSQGIAENGADKNALQEARNPIQPSLPLLRARLLFDGGYFDKALVTILQAKPRDLKDISEQIEYHYRTGRIHHSLGNLSAALASYRLTLDMGKNFPFYFACNAALQIGLIYEKQKNLALARQYFRLCLSLNPSDYSNSLHQSAKAGLNRLDDL